MVIQNGKLKNSYVENVNVDVSYRTSGKLVGWIQDSKVEYCYSKGGSASGHIYVGGLVGFLWNGQIKNSYSINGEIYDTYGSGGGIIGGGISGITTFINDNRVINCYTTDKNYKKSAKKFIKSDCCGVGGQDIGILVKMIKENMCMFMLIIILYIVLFEYRYY